MTPTQQQIRAIEPFLFRAGCIIDGTLKIAIIVLATYLAIVIGSTFLPGHTVERVLGGAK